DRVRFRRHACGHRHTPASPFLDLCGSRTRSKLSHSPNCNFLRESHALCRNASILHLFCCPAIDDFTPPINSEPVASTLRAYLVYGWLSDCDTAQRSSANTATSQHVRCGSTTRKWNTSETLEANLAESGISRARWRA